MPAYKDKKTGLFYVQFYYRDARGAKRHKTKKGFQTELEALLWEKNFKALKDDAMDMTFADFCKVYKAEVRPRVREHTWLESTPIPLTPFMPPLGGLRHPANWPLRTRPGSCSPAPSGSSRGCTPPRCARRCRARPRRAWRRPARARTPTSRCP